MSESTVRLGLMPPLTGLVGMYGAEISCAGQIACAEVNESGGVLGKPLELVIEDDGSLPESAVAAAAKLVDQHRCAAIIGNLLSNSRIAVAYEVAEPRRIPYLNFSFYEGSILSYYYFHFAALPNQQIEQMIPYMRNQHGPRMFFAGNNYEWPRGSIDAAKLALEQSGGQIVGEEYYPIGVSNSDIERLLDQVAKSGAEVFVPYFAGADQIQLLTRFTERNLKSRMAVVMGHYDEVMSSRLPPAVREGFYSSNTYFMTLDTPENNKYLARLAARPEVNGVWPPGNGILTNFGEGAYLCVKAFAKAANLAGSLEPEALVKTLETISISGPQGAVQMDPATHHARVNTYLSRCRADGSFAIIERFGAIPPVLPERYRHLRISKQSGLEDIHLQSRMMAQITEAALLVHATDNVIVYTNPGAERMFGYGPGELAGKSFSVLFAPTDQSQEDLSATIGAILSKKGVWQGETEHIARDGKRFWCTASASVFTHPKYGEVWMILNKDISERKRVEKELAQSEALFRNYFELGQVGMAITSLNQEWLQVNRRLCEMLGYTKEELCKMTWTELTHPDDLEPDLAQFNKLLSGEIERYSMNKRFFRKDRRIVHTDLTVACQRISDGSVDYIIASLQDITERKQAEEQLRSASQYARSLIEASLDPLVTISAEGKITDVNEATVRATGMTRVALIGSDFSDFFTNPEQARAGYQEVFAKGFVTDYPLALRHVSGRITEVIYNAGVYRNDKGEVAGIFAAARDITERLWAERELRAASLYARSLIEASLDPLVTISAEGKITDVNEATIRATGVARVELIGSDFSDYFTEPEQARAGYQEVFAKGFVTDYPLVLRHVSGNIMDVLYNASVYRNDKNDVVGAFAAARDITKRKAAEQKAMQLSLRNRLILDSAGEGIYGLDINGRCTFINPAASQMLGFTVDDLVGQHSHSMFHHTKQDGSPYPQEECPVLAAYQQGAVHRGVDMYWRKDGSGFPVEFVSTPTREAEQITGAVVVFSDITDRKRAEKELHTYHEHLEELVRERTSQLETANKDLEGFAYSVSHDLRVPLRAIDGFSQQILKRYENQLDNEGKRYLNIVRDNTKRMSRLIDDILAFSRMGRLGMSMSEIDTEGLVRDVFEELKTGFAGRELSLEIKPLPLCCGDPAMLRQVWVNLLGNAIKFTQPRTLARVEVCGHTEGAETIYYVKDNGAGFDMQYADKLFGVFQRLHGIEEFDGTGIGLAIVKRIIARHGGRVWAEGKVDEGATFYFSLPKKGG